KTMPMAPLAAARRAGMAPLLLDDVAARITALDGPDRTVLVVGAGGLLVRLGADGPGDAGQWGLPELVAHVPGAKAVVVTLLGLGQPQRRRVDRGSRPRPRHGRHRARRRIASHRRR